MKTAIRYIVAFCTTLGLAGLVLVPCVYALDVVNCDGLTGTAAEQCKTVSQDKLNYKKSDNYVWNVVQFLFTAIGGLSVIMLIVGGIQFATSNGDAGAVAKAKNTVLYSVIGVVVALVADTIVVFVINNIPK